MKDNLLKLKYSNKLTEYQIKGLYLEVATFLALRQLGIEPVPLHNPFTEEYAKDQHLKVDLIFIYNRKLFGIECKNLSYASHVGLDFIENEITERFINTDLPFNHKIVIFGVCNYNQARIPREYMIVELGYQVDLNNIEEAISALTTYLKSYLNNLKSIPNSLNTIDNSLYLLHGYKARESRLRRIDKKLHRRKDNQAV